MNQRLPAHPPDQAGGHASLPSLDVVDALVKWPAAIQVPIALQFTAEEGAR